MNYEEEKALQRQVLGANHGESLTANARRLQPGQDPKAYVFPGTAVGPHMTAAQASSPALHYAAKIGSVNVIEKMPEKVHVPDTERMIRQMDALYTTSREVTDLASKKLERFAEPRPGSIEPASVDTRQCSSEYFRMLESRVEMLNERFAYLHELLNSISAPIDTGPLNGKQA